MEFLGGETLEQRIASGQLLNESEARDVLKPLLEALQEVHTRAFLHRDIKPSNIVLTSARPELIDFGTAITFKRGQTVNVSELVLTPEYAPLEQYATHAKLGPYTDLYALAATFYEAITGVKPPPSLERANGVKLIPIRDLKPNISEGFAAMLEKALSIPVAQRIATATQMHELLRKHERSARFASFATNVPTWFSAAAIALWILLLGLPTYSAFNPPMPPPAPPTPVTRESNPPVIYFKATQATWGAVRCNVYTPYLSASFYKDQAGTGAGIGWDFEYQALDPKGAVLGSIKQHMGNWSFFWGTGSGPNGTYRLKGTADGVPFEAASSASVPTYPLETPASLTVKFTPDGRFLQIEWAEVPGAGYYAMESSHGGGRVDANQPRLLRIRTPGSLEDISLMLLSVNLPGPKINPADRGKPLRASVLASRTFTVEDVRAAGGSLSVYPKNPCSF